MPFKARLRGSKLKKGYATIAVINENKSLDFRKEQIIDGTIKLDDSFHAIADYDIFTYKNKPFIFQAKNKLNPYNPLSGQHETYGQKYVMGRMESDKITAKKKLGWGIGIIGFVVVAVVVYALLTGG